MIFPETLSFRLNRKVNRYLKTSGEGQGQGIPGIDSKLLLPYTDECRAEGGAVTLAPNAACPRLRRRPAEQMLGMQKRT